MAYIKVRKQSDGSTRYTAIIRLRNGKTFNANCALAERPGGMPDKYGSRCPAAPFLARGYIHRCRWDGSRQGRTLEIIPTSPPGHVAEVL
jgi:hypothetical protein